MGTSLKTLRQEIGRDLRECFVGTVASAGASNIICTALIDPDESPSLYDRAWVKIVDGEAAGDVRRVRATQDSVQGYTPDTGMLQLSAPLSDTAVAGDEFEVHGTIDPDELDRTINDGLERCSYLTEEELFVVAGQTEYDLSEFAWLTRQGQVVDVHWVYGSTALEQQHIPLRWFNVQLGEGIVTLHIDPIGADGDTLMLVAVRPYDALEDDEDETECPLEWIKAQAVWGVYNWLARGGPAKDVERYTQAFKGAAEHLMRLNRYYAPRPARRILTPRSPLASYSRGAP